MNEVNAKFLTIIIASAIIVWICFLITEEREHKKSKADNVLWCKSKDWTCTQNGITKPIEFGFCDDGSIKWRISNE